jgi:hypothetical protein
MSDEAVNTPRDLFTLVASDRTSLLARSDGALAAVRAFELLPRSPIVTATSMVRRLAASRPTADRSIDTLVLAAILVETTGKWRDRAFAYDAYLQLLRDGTDLTPL